MKNYKAVEVRCTTRGCLVVDSLSQPLKARSQKEKVPLSLQGNGKVLKVAVGVPRGDVLRGESTSVRDCRCERPWVRKAGRSRPKITRERGHMDDFRNKGGEQGENGKEMKTHATRDQVQNTGREKEMMSRNRLCSPTLGRKRQSKFRQI